MPKVISKPKRPRMEGDEKNREKANKLHLALQVDHVLSLYLQNLGTNDLLNARFLSPLWKQEAEKVLAARILSNWIPFTLYGPEAYTKPEGFPMVKIASPDIWQTRNSRGLHVHLPVGMKSAINPFFTRSLVIWEPNTFFPAGAENNADLYDMLPTPINNLLATLGQNLSSLMMNNVTLFPKALVELLSLTPHVRAMFLCFISFKVQLNQDFERNLVMPPLKLLNSLKLINNTDTAGTASYNYWLLKSYAGQLEDLQLDAKKFIINYDSLNPLELPSISMGKLQRLYVFAPSYSFTSIVHAKQLSFLAISMSEVSEWAFDQVNLSEIFEFVVKFASTLRHLQFKTDWFSGNVHKNFWEFYSRPKVDFPVLTKLALSWPVNDPPNGSVFAAKTLVSKFKNLEEVRLMITGLNCRSGTEEPYKRGEDSFKRSVEQQEYWVDSPLIQNIWVELEGHCEAGILRHGRFLVWNKEEWNIAQLAQQELA